MYIGILNYRAGYMLDLHWSGLEFCVDHFVRLNSYQFSILNIRSTFVAMSKKLNTTKINENCEKKTCIQ